MLTRIFMVTFELSSAPLQDVTFRYNLVDITNEAEKGVDYTEPTNRSERIAMTANPLTTSITIPIKGDTLHEGNETFKIVVTNITGAVSTEKTTTFEQIITITDDETPTLSVDNSSFNVVEDVAGGNFVINYSITGETSQDATFTFTWDNNFGTATENVDFTIPLINTGRIAMGETTGRTLIPIIPDMMKEGNETFRINLFNLNGAVFSGGGATLPLTITIVDDELPTIKVAQSIEDAQNTVEVNESSGMLNIDVNLSGPTHRGMVFRYETINMTATSPEDYTGVTSASNTTRTIAAGGTSYRIQIPIIDDGLHEGNHEFKVRITDLTSQIFGETATPIEITVTIVDNETPTLSLANTSFEVDEDDGNFVANFQLSGVGRSDVRITYSLMDGSAEVSDMDFTIPTTPLSIARGTTTASLSIPITDDSKNEGNEDFTLVISQIVNAVSSEDSSRFSQVITIVDDEDPTISFAQAITEVAESGGMVNVVVNLTGATDAPVVITYETVDVSATSPNDFTGISNASPATETIAVGDTSATLRIPIIEDSIREGNETFKVKITNATNAEFTDTTAQFIESTVSITDNEVPTLSISDSTISVTETDADQNFDVTFMLSSAPLQDVTFQYSLVDVTATKGTDANSDYSEPTNKPVTETIAMNANPLTTTITIPIKGDTSNEGNETFKIVVTNISGAVSSADMTTFEQVITIVDDEMPTLKLTNSSFEVAENVSGGNFDVGYSLTGETSSDVVINYMLTADSATAGADFYLPSDMTGATLTGQETITMGQTTGMTSITIVEDMENEGNHNFTFEITSITGAVFMGGTLPHTETITIVDDEPPTVSVAPTINVNESNTLKMVDVVVNLSGPTGNAVVLTYSTEDMSAKAPGDYTAVTSESNTTTTIPIGDSSVTIQIPIIGDTDNEGNEKFKVKITDLTNLVSGGSTTQYSTIVTIVDDEEPTLMLANSSFDVREDISTEASNGNFVVNFKLSGETSEEVTFSYALMNDTALADDDFTVPTETVSIPIGMTTASLSIPILHDELNEGNETFTLQITSIDEAVAADNTDAFSQIITIVDDEDPIIRFTNTITDVAEAVGLASIPLHLSGPTDQVVEIRYATASGTAIAGFDFAEISAARPVTVTIPIGETSTNLIFPIIEDNIFEGNETFAIGIVSVSGAVIPENTPNNILTTSVRIVDNELPQLTISSATTSVDEDVSGGDFNITFTLDRPTTDEVRFTYDLEKINDNEAIPDTDYVDLKNQPGRIEIGASETTATIEILDDMINEGNERFRVKVFSLFGARSADGLTQFTQIITIVDNEMPTLEIKNSPIEVAEDVNGGNLVLDFELTGDTDGIVSFSYTLTSPGDTATIVTDYANVQTPITIPIGMTTASLTVPIVTDDMNEGNETFTLAITGLTNAVFADGTNSHSETITIIDDELPAVSVASNNIEIMEEDSSRMVEFNVNLSNPSDRAIVLSYETVNMTATAPDDFTAVTSPNNSLTIPRGMEQATIQIPIVNDDDNEGNEEFKIIINNLTALVVGESFTPIEVIVKIIDNEVPTMSLSNSLSNSTFEVMENVNGGNFIINFNLSGETGSNVTFDYALTGGTATDVDDFTTPTDTLSIPIGMTTTSLNYSNYC